MGSVSPQPNLLPGEKEFWVWAVLRRWVGGRALRPFDPFDRLRAGRLGAARPGIWTFWMVQDGGEVSPLASCGIVPPSVRAGWRLGAGPIGGLQAAFWHTGDMVPGAVSGEFLKNL